MKFNETFKVEKELEKKFFGKELIFIDQYTGEDIFVGLISTSEYGMNVTIVKSFDSHIKCGDSYALKVKKDYIIALEGDEEVAIWSEDWDKKYHN